MTYSPTYGPTYNLDGVSSYGRLRRVLGRARAASPRHAAHTRARAPVRALCAGSTPGLQAVDYTRTQQIEAHARTHNTHTRTCTHEIQGEAQI
jgi:hypothetical protein